MKVNAEEGGVCEEDDNRQEGRCARTGDDELMDAVDECGWCCSMSMELRCRTHNDKVRCERL